MQEKACQGRDRISKLLFRLKPNKLPSPCLLMIMRSVILNQRLIPEIVKHLRKRLIQVPQKHCHIPYEESEDSTLHDANAVIFMILHQFLVVLVIAFAGQRAFAEGRNSSVGLPVIDFARRVIHLDGCYRIVATDIIVLSVDGLNVNSRVLRGRRRFVVEDALAVDVVPDAVRVTRSNALRAPAEPGAVVQRD